MEFLGFKSILLAKEIKFSRVFILKIKSSPNKMNLLHKMIKKI
jgi:hypothetical protein